MRHVAVNKKHGFSLIELVVVIAILAIISVLLVPALLQYTESSRAQKDVSAMDEVVNAVQLAMSDPDCFDEMLKYSCNNNFITYTDSSGKYGQQVVDAEYWAPDGYGKATTITFNPEKGDNNSTIYRLDHAIVNDMTYGNGSIAESRVMEGEKTSNSQCYFANAKLTDTVPSGYTYNKVRQTIGNDVITTSQTYRNSSFTIFIKFSQRDGTSISEINGMFNGTNLDKSSSNASLGSGTNSEAIDPNNGDKIQGPATTPSGGTTSANFGYSAMQGSGSISGTNEYVKPNDMHDGAVGTLSIEKFNGAVVNKGITKLVFSTQGLSSGIDISEEQNNSVLLKINGTECVVSTNRYNQPIKCPASLSGMFNSGQHWEKVQFIDASGLDVSNVTDFTRLFTDVASEATTFNLIGLNTWDVSNCTNATQMFSSLAQNAQTITISGMQNWNFESCETMKKMFFYLGYKSQSINLGDLSKWNTSNVKSMEGMFEGTAYEAKTVVIGDIGQWNVSNVETMARMFTYFGQKCNNLSFGNLGNWNVSRCKNFEYLFSYVGHNAETVYFGDLSSWSFEATDSLYCMFYYSSTYANSVTIGDLSKWDVSHIKNFQLMFFAFGYVAKPNLNLSGWDVSLATDYTQFNDQAPYIIPPKWN